MFTQAPGETLAMSFRDSYARLIAYRERQYEKYCDVQMEYGIHRQRGLSAEDFFWTGFVLV
jgi:hypothetical protein